VGTKAIYNWAVTSPDYSASGSSTNFKEAMAKLTSAIEFARQTSTEVSASFSAQLQELPDYENEKEDNLDHG
jgi:hypothetical protein